MQKDMYYLGIDGGGTKTDLALADREGDIIRTLKADSCNPVDIGIEAAKGILKNAIYEICAGIPLSSVCVFAGIAGGVSAGMQEKLRGFFNEFNFLNFLNDSDNKNIIAAGLGERDGITLILGTGICAYIQKNNKHERVAGWGYLIDNGGSGYNLGRDALNAHFCAIDGTGAKTALSEEINKIYPGDTQELMGYIYSGGKKAIASFAPAVFAALEKGDKAAKRVFQCNMKEAAHILETAAQRFSKEKIPVILAGGLTNQQCVIECLKNSLENTERYEISVLDTAPVEGAVLLAKQLNEWEKKNEQNRNEKS